MKGKIIKKKNVGKIVLIGMSFLLTVLLTFSITLAWFYDADWASNYINMAGSVGIEIRRQQKLLPNGDPDPADTNLLTSGAGNLKFTITTEKAYPGQAIDVSASVYNNGGKSGAGGSQCYVRAHFAVYTNIAVGYDIDRADYGSDADYYAALNALYKLNPADYDTTAKFYAALDAEKAIAVNEKNMGADALYDFFNTLIDKQNTDNSVYFWKYYRAQGSKPLSSSGISTGDVLHYFEGSSAAAASNNYDRGYFYLCKPDQETLLPLELEQTAVFLWNNTFIIPWNLTNASADKYLFVAVTFQAIQTFIPVIDANGVISDEANNQTPADACKYNNHSVQTVFNSCAFKPIDTSIKIDENTTIDFADGNYDVTSLPSTQRT